MRLGFGVGGLSSCGTVQAVVLPGPLTLVQCSQRRLPSKFLFCRLQGRVFIIAHLLKSAYALFARNGRAGSHTVRFTLDRPHRAVQLKQGSNYRLGGPHMSARLSSFPIPIPPAKPTAPSLSRARFRGGDSGELGAGKAQQNSSAGVGGAGRVGAEFPRRGRGARVLLLISPRPAAQDYFTGKAMGCVGTPACLRARCRGLMEGDLVAEIRCWWRQYPGRIERDGDGSTTAASVHTIYG